MILEIYINGRDSKTGIYIDFQEFIKEIDLESIEDSAYEFSLDWNKNISSKFLTYKNVNLAPVSQLSVYFFIKDLFVCQYLIDHIYSLNSGLIKIKIPKEIGHLLRNILREKKYKNVKVKRVFTKDDFSFINLTKLSQNFFKKFHLDTFIKHVVNSLYLMKYIQFKKKSYVGDILIYPDVNNDPTNYTLKLLFDELNKDPETNNVKITCTDNRVIKKFFENIATPLIVFLNFRVLFKFITICPSFIVKNLFLIKKYNNFEYKIIYRFFKKLILFFYSTNFFDLLLIKEMFLKTKPSIILLGTDCHRITRLITILAKDENIKTIVVQHGATNGKFGFSPLFADYFIAWGNLSKNILTTWGVSENKIITLGNPRYDIFFKKLEKIRKMEINEYMTIALSGWNMEESKYFLKLIYNWSKTLNKHVKFCIKPHPSEPNLEELRTFIERNLKGFMLIDKNIDVLTLIKSSLCLISSQSTVCIEAISLGCPVIEVDLPFVRKIIPFDKFDCVYNVASVNDFKIAVNSILEKDENFKIKGEKAQEFLYEYIGVFDGKSSIRIKEFIKDLLKNGENNESRK
ncbi:MAG: hypothetical protein C6W54_12420 [Bacillaceae bacterium]|jgi:hypothetical protein|uniref:UDP-N-acetylglucosamine 2-epimerase domain-containing protein n=1 Tax=Aeribacillus pallidus TaxID=33936 RepID=A0A165WQR0_9BACI|nr:hypothetical protein [Aeribacillus pallidus]KZN95210.1 hypothetical protein AZI98_14485 [Aeribacillus pallidus]REJ22854.1 MAG: hypothetical protein C6W54_12420 [Bacillaceae bacterium]